MQLTKPSVRDLIGRLVENIEFSNHLVEKHTGNSLAMAVVKATEPYKPLLSQLKTEFDALPAGSSERIPTPARTAWDNKAASAIVAAITTIQAPLERLQGSGAQGQIMTPGRTSHQRITTHGLFHANDSYLQDERIRTQRNPGERSDPFRGFDLEALEARAELAGVGGKGGHVR